MQETRPWARVRKRVRKCMGEKGLQQRIGEVVHRPSPRPTNEKQGGFGP